MSSTRYADPASDPDAANERHLASAKLRGIQIGLNIVARVARVCPEAEGRAMIWLVNYARYRRLTADALSEELDLSKADIRTALTDPDADRSRFVRQVAALRQQFEASLPTVVDTAPVRQVREAFLAAFEEHALVEAIGQTRMGKTKAGAEPLYLRHLDRCVWLDCPSDETDRSFLFALGAAMGIAGGTSKKAGQLRPQLASVFATGMIDLLIVDEAHYLWPADKHSKPKRLEFLRCEVHRDGDVGVLVIATPQFSESMRQIMDANPRWAPGQWDGRVFRYHLPDTMTDVDLRAVASHYAPDFDPALIESLVIQAKACDGFAGLMVNTIRLANRKARAAGATVVTSEILKEAQAQMARGTRIEQLAREAAARPTTSPKPRFNGAGHPAAHPLTLNGTTVRV